MSPWAESGLHPIESTGQLTRSTDEGTLPTKLRLVDSTPTTTGVVILNYEPVKD